MNIREVYERNEEREIDLKQLMWRIIDQWKIILLVMLIGAVCGTALGYVKTGRLIGTEEAAQTIDSAYIAGLRTALSESERLKVDEAYKIQQQIDAMGKDNAGSSSVQSEDTYYATATLSSLIGSLNSLEANFSTDQSTLYTAMVDSKYNLENGTVGVEAKVKEETTGTTSTIKYALIGLIVGFIGVIAFVALREIFRGTVYSSTEIAELYGISDLGDVHRSKNGKGLFGKIRYKHRPEQAAEIDYYAKFIEAKTAAYNRVVILSIDAMSDNDKAVASKLFRKISDKAQMVDNGRSSLHLVDILKDADGVVLLIEDERSKNNDVQKMMLMCCDMDMDVIGAAGI